MCEAEHSVNAADCRMRLAAEVLPKFFGAELVAEVGGRPRKENPKLFTGICPLNAGVVAAFRPPAKVGKHTQTWKAQAVPGGLVWKID